MPNRSNKLNDSHLSSNWLVYTNCTCREVLPTIQAVEHDQVIMLRLPISH